MSKNLKLLKLVTDEVKPEIIVTSQLYSDAELLYKLTETTAEQVIQTICEKHKLSNKDFVGLYEDVINIIKKRIIIT